MNPVNPGSKHGTNQSLCRIRNLPSITSVLLLAKEKTDEVVNRATRSEKAFIDPSPPTGGSG
jgi:hypothetical protein